MSNIKVDIQKSSTGQRIISVNGDNFLFFQETGGKIEMGPMEGDRLMYEYTQTYSLEAGRKVLQEMIRMRKGMI